MQQTLYLEVFFIILLKHLKTSPFSDNFFQSFSSLLRFFILMVILIFILFVRFRLLSYSFLFIYCSIVIYLFDFDFFTLENSLWWIYQLLSKNPFFSFSLKNRDNFFSRNYLATGNLTADLCCCFLKILKNLDNSVFVTSISASITYLWPELFRLKRFCDNKLEKLTMQPCFIKICF